MSTINPLLFLKSLHIQNFALLNHFFHLRVLSVSFSTHQEALGALVMGHFLKEYSIITYCLFFQAANKHSASLARVVLILCQFLFNSQRVLK